MKAVIFDLDGTLLDTLEDIADSMNAVLSRRGLPLNTTEDYKYFVGDGAANLVRRAAKGAESAGHTFAEIEDEYRAEYSARQIDKTAPYPGIPELLSSLAGHGVKMAVFSNKPHDSTVEVVARLLPDVYFCAVIGQRPGYPIKPDPGGVREILGILGLRRGDVLYVGDTGTDMQTAKAAGLKAAGVLWGFRGEAELIENGADMVAKHPLELLDLLGL